MRFKKTSKRRRSTNFDYSQLEDRQLLAAMVMGGNGNERVEVIYVEPNVVDIKIDETVRGNVDISAGLHINLNGGFA